ncbi:hypothetical protein [Ponticaulis profundi]|uniref:Uncharacterized protein n=1 Tax=Ponticaulis profundi TaxID=2665222 RepID=A0ABW1S840_9PROT
MSEITIAVRVTQPTEADWKAAERDINAIYDKYGEPEDWAPHNATKAQAEIDRVYDVIEACVDVEEVFY